MGAIEAPILNLIRNSQFIEQFFERVHLENQDHTALDLCVAKEKILVNVNDLVTDGIKTV